MLNKKYSYPLKKILAEYPLPCEVTKYPGKNEYFQIISYNSDVARARYFINGAEKKRLFGDYKLRLSDFYYLYGNNYDKEGFNCDGFDRDGYDRAGFNNHGFDRDGYNKEGFNQEGFDREGYNNEGYNKEGFNRAGYNIEGYDRNGFNIDGFNPDGLDQEGYNSEGFNKEGFNREGYDRDGFTKDGYNQEGFNRHGYDRDGFDKNGNSKDSNNLKKNNKELNLNIKKGSASKLLNNKNARLCDQDIDLLTIKELMERDCYTSKDELFYDSIVDLTYTSYDETYEVWNPDDFECDYYEDQVLVIIEQEEERLLEAEKQFYFDEYIEPGEFRIKNNIGFHIEDGFDDDYEYDTKTPVSDSVQKTVLSNPATIADEKNNIEPETIINSAKGKDPTNKEIYNSLYINKTQIEDLLQIENSQLSIHSKTGLQLLKDSRISERFNDEVFHDNTEYETIIWERLIEASEHTQTCFKFCGFHHHADFATFLEIYNSGKLYCRNSILKDANIVDVADQASIEAAPEYIKNSVRFYFGPKTPTYYLTEGIKKDTTGAGHGNVPIPVAMIFGKELLHIPGTAITDGSAAKAGTYITPFYKEALGFNWEKILSRGKPDSGYDSSYTRERHAEFLVPFQVDLKYIYKICFRSKADYKHAQFILGNDFRFTVDPDMFEPVLPSNLFRNYMVHL